MAHSISISWDPSPSTVDGYNIFRGTAPGNESIVPYNVGLIAQGSAVVLSSVDASVSGGAVYHGVITGGDSDAFVGQVFQVKGFASGNSAVVNNGTFQCLASSATSLTLANSKAIAETHSAMAVPNPFFKDFAVIPGHIYSYRITAVAGGRESLDSVDVLSVAVPFGPTPAPINVGVANSFEILAGSTITNTGATTAAGDVGVWPGTSITGFGAPAAISGVFHAGDFVAAAAQAALTSAYNAAAAALNPGGAPATTLTGDIGGQTLTPGVYKSTSSLAITGTLVLDGLGDPNSVFIFQIGSTLTTATSNSNIVLLGGAQAANIFWQVGSSATLGVGTNFSGTIMAQASITVNTGVRVNGRLLARVGAVTLDSDSIVMFLSASLALYLPNHAYSLGAIIFDCVSQSFQQVAVPGISGATRPNFSPVLNVLTQDGTITWVSLDPPEVNVLVSLPPSGPNVPPAPPAAPTNPKITVEV